MVKLCGAHTVGRCVALSLNRAGGRRIAENGARHQGRLFHRNMAYESYDMIIYFRKNSDYSTVLQELLKTCTTATDSQFFGKA